MSYAICKDCKGWRYCEILNKLNVSGWEDRINAACGKIQDDPSEKNVDELRKIYKRIPARRNHDHLR